ncbi:MAG: heme transport system permease protein [Thermomicrobiales bacterium]|jgi:iron complex transport system permease protein|nr:heme transport system permease protein [Thermomicrobiales bacterium]MEA2593795.1 heme transport system permease protein [Thermomicrobiales bacterium]
MPPAVLLPSLGVLLLVAIVLSVGIGAVKLQPQQTVAIIAHHLGVELDVAYTTQQDAIVWAIRLPRVVTAVLVGSALAVSGAALQGMFRNPLADPGLIGVSSGAALGAVTSVALGISFLGLATMPVAAFLGGMTTAITVYLISRHNGRTEIVTLVLTGIALNTIAGAGTGLLTYVASDQQLRAIVFWSLGSLGGATWKGVLATLPFVGVGLIFVPRWGQALNLFVLGEREAHHLGVDTERVRLELIVLTALMTGAAVAVAGVVGFVGLIVPHLIRLVAGPDHRIVLPASALFGASLLLLADLLARTIVAPAELPLGVLTALAGGPFLLVLMLRTRQAQGGWG